MSKVSEIQTYSQLPVAIQHLSMSKVGLAEKLYSQKLTTGSVEFAFKLAAMLVSVFLLIFRFHISGSYVVTI